MKLVCHISSDEVLLLVPGVQQIVVPYVDLERRLPGVLVGCVEQYQIDSVYVINGPGSFTLLRIGVLCVTVLQQHVGRVVEVYDVPKMAVYEKLIAQGDLPPVGALFVGQRKKMAVYSSDMLNEHGDVRSDVLFDSDGMVDQLQGQEYWLDYVTDHVVAKRLQERDGDDGMLVDWFFDGNDLSMQYRGRMVSVRLDAIAVKVSCLEARYMMQPIMH